MIVGVSSLRANYKGKHPPYDEHPQRSQIVLMLERGVIGEVVQPVKPGPFTFIQG